MKRIFIKIFAFVLTVVISISFAYAAQLPVENSVTTNSVQAVAIDHDTLVNFAIEAGVALTANSQVTQVASINSEGQLASSIMVKTELADKTVIDFITPYSYDESAATMVNSFLLASTYGYLPGIATLPDIFIDARCYVYEESYQGAQYLRPVEFAAKYTLTNSAVQMYSIQGNCEIVGSAYDESFTLIGHNFGWSMDFYQANPAEGVFYSSPSSQALTSVWLSFGGSVGGDGIGYYINYSGYINGEFFRFDDTTFHPLTNI